MVSEERRYRFAKNCLEDIKIILLGRGAAIGGMIYEEIEEEMGAVLVQRIREHDRERETDGA